MGREKLLIIFCLFLYAFANGGILAQEYRLSKDVIPDAYDIAIKPYLQTADDVKQFTFDGEVNITLHAMAQNIQNIILHKDYIDIEETILYDASGSVVQNIASDKLIYDDNTDKLTVPLAAALKVNENYIVYFKYTGQIRSGLAGVFRGSYDNESWYAITQLQRIDARTAFPCFDEPQLKATFRMRINRPKEYRSYFNTRLLETISDGDARYIDIFEETPPMSSYLVAFLVGDFVDEGDADLKLIMHPSVIGKTNFTREVAQKTMGIYDNYTQIPYKTLGNTLMQKAGSIRFPHNGMENWGLVLYRDSVLSHEPNYTDGYSDKEYTITILVHETAHMWFGNSVTFKWWSYFWLNEAFARYYQYFLAHEIYPEYELDKQFVVNQIHLIFGTDAINSTQPMTSPEESVNTPAQIASKFSGIAYAKGAAIVRMIRNIMGSENFDASIREYLKENHLKSVVPDDLFLHWKQHWPQNHNVDLQQFFSDWTEQPGFPILRLSITRELQYRLTQERFLLNPDDGSDDSLKYTIPITYTTHKERNFEDLTPKFYFNKSMSEVLFDYNANTNEWIILNLQQSNYHRVYYEPFLLKRIQKNLMAQPNDIHVINRAQLIDDIFNFARIELMGYDEVFEFLEYLANETDYLPWNPAFKGFDFIYPRLTMAQHEKFGKFLFDIMSNVYGKLGFGHANDTVLDIYNRNKVINWLCRYHHPDCIYEAQSFFFELEKAQSVSTDFQETLYCAAMRDGTFYYYITLNTWYKKETLTSQKEKLLRAMGCTRYFAEYHYAFILSDDVAPDLKVMAINSLYTQTPENVMTIYLAVMQTAEYLGKQLGWSSTASLISGITNYLTTQEQLTMLEDFIESKGHLFGTSVSTLENAVPTVEKNLAWSEKHLTKLFNYLDARSNGAATVNSLATMLTTLVVVFLKLNW